MLHLLQTLLWKGKCSLSACNRYPLSYHTIGHLLIPFMPFMERVRNHMHINTSLKQLFISYLSWSVPECTQTTPCKMVTRLSQSAFLLELDSLSLCFQNKPHIILKVHSFLWFKKSVLWGYLHPKKWSCNDRLWKMGFRGLLTDMWEVVLTKPKVNLKNAIPRVCLVAKNRKVWWCLSAGTGGVGCYGKKLQDKFQLGF